MATKPALRDGVSRDDLLAVSREFGLGNRFLRQLRESGVLPTPRRFGKPGGGSISLYPAEFAGILRRFLSERSAHGDEIRRLKAEVGLRNSRHPMLALPSESSDWEAHQLDRAVLDVLYAEDLADLRYRTLGFDGTKADYDRTRVWGYRRVDQIDPRDLLVFYHSQKRAFDSSGVSRVRFRKKMGLQDAGYDVVCGPLGLAYGISHHGFLACFPSGESLKAFQSKIVGGLVSLIEGRIRNTSDRTSDVVEEPTLRADVLVMIKQADYLRLPDEDGDKDTSDLYTIPFVPQIVGVDAKEFVLGRLRHVWQSAPDPNMKPGDALARRFGFCAACQKLFIKTNLRGRGQVSKCGHCATLPRKRGKDFAIDPDLI